MRLEVGELRIVGRAQRRPTAVRLKNGENMKRIITIVVLTMLMMSPALAQENKRPRFNPEEFKAKQETFITQKAELTQAEAEKAFPLFWEMKNKQFEVMKKIQKLKYKTPLEDEDDYQDAMGKIGELNIDNAKIEASYYKKIGKTLSAQKAFRIRMADDAFHREVLRRANNSTKNKPPRK